MTTTGKKAFMKELVNEEGIIGALAIDQRGALKKMITTYKKSDNLETDIIEFKENIELYNVLKYKCTYKYIMFI